MLHEVGSFHICTIWASLKYVPTFKSGDTSWKMGALHGPLFFDDFLQIFIQEFVDASSCAVCKIIALYRKHAPIGCKHLGKYSF